MSRVQLALNVPNLDEAVAFYSKLFATEPNKRKPGYANFAITEPPLKLVLFETCRRGAQAQPPRRRGGVESTRSGPTGPGCRNRGSSRSRSRAAVATPGRTRFWVGRSRRQLGDLHRGLGLVTCSLTDECCRAVSSCT